MTTRQTTVLRQLASRGALAPASIAAATGMPTAGVLQALYRLREQGCVDNQHGGYWTLTTAGVDALRAAGVGR